MVVLAKEIPSLHGNLRNLHFFTGTTHIFGALNLHFSYFGGPRAETNIFAPGKWMVGIRSFPFGAVCC